MDSLLADDRLRRTLQVKELRNVSPSMVASFISRSENVVTVVLSQRCTGCAEWCDHISLSTVFKVRERRPRISIILDSHNTSSHTTTRTSELLSSWRAYSITYPPYSPELAPCGLFLMSIVNKQMHALILGSPEEVIEAYKNFLSEMFLVDWIQCFQDWFYRSQKCVGCNKEHFTNRK